MELFKTETKNRDYLFSQLKNVITFKDSRMLMDTEVPVPYKHIYIPSLPKKLLEIWCFKQDICLYEELYNKKIGYKDARIISVKDISDEILNIKLEKDSSQNSHHVGLPYVIIETKMGKSINTHELLAYSEKVQMIKTIFPYCRFIMLFFGEPPTRAFRHGVNFDEIIYITSYDEETIDYVQKVIERMYKEAIHDIVRMKV